MRVCVRQVSELLWHQRTRIVWLVSNREAVTACSRGRSPRSPFPHDLQPRSGDSAPLTETVTDATPILLSPLRGWVGSGMRIPWVSPTATYYHRFAAQNTADGESRFYRLLGYTHLTCGGPVVALNFWVTQEQEGWKGGRLLRNLLGCCPPVGSKQPTGATPRRQTQQPLVRWRMTRPG